MILNNFLEENIGNYSGACPRFHDTLGCNELAVAQVRTPRVLLAVLRRTDEKRVLLMSYSYCMLLLV